MLSLAGLQNAMGFCTISAQSSLEPPPSQAPLSSVPLRALTLRRVVAAEGLGSCPGRLVEIPCHLACSFSMFQDASGMFQLQISASDPASECGLRSEEKPPSCSKAVCARKVGLLYGCCFRCSPYLRKATNGS